MSHVTLQDIAKEAGVSTISREPPLNGKPDVNPKTKNKIL